MLSDTKEDVEIWWTPEQAERWGKALDWTVGGDDDEAPDQEPDGFVYFIGGEVGAIKIGYTKNLRQRLTRLHASSPIPLSILASVPGTVIAEARYHGRFKTHRLHGEWFERHPDILAEIERLNA